MTKKSNIKESPVTEENLVQITFDGTVYEYREEAVISIMKQNMYNVPVVFH